VAKFTLVSDPHPTLSPIQSLFEFLIDFKNFASILPPDKIENFNVFEDGCSFSIKGITHLTVKIKEKQANDFILFSSEGLAKFNFDLKAIFNGEATQTGDCLIEMYGDLNPFIKTMVEKPLLSLINTMSLKLSQLKLN